MGYGSTSTDPNALFHAPSLTIEAKADQPTKIKWINDLKDLTNIGPDDPYQGGVLGDGIVPETFVSADPDTTGQAKFDIAGLYVWHCHILEHEDNDMMRPFRVQ